MTLIYIFVLLSVVSQNLEADEADLLLPVISQSLNADHADDADLYYCFTSCC